MPERPPSLFLVRHGNAISEAKNSERPLSPWGRTDVHKMAVFAAEKANVKITKILHSGQVRARQTAEILSEWLSPSEGVGETTGLSPMDDPIVWADQVAGLEQPLMLVGHLPHLERLASQLLCGRADHNLIHFPTSGMICLERHEDQWSLSWMAIPNHLDSPETPIA